ncbi:hypothetical protein RhiLY_01759 [Ceratobasidium sp. AG-Ba]|nr:hypothetical protein RhiLY_01759 [Ceratobasidium sp. AG-Ba]
MSTSLLATIYELTSLCYSDRPPNWSALSDWLASIFIHPASRLADSDRSSQLLLRDVDKRSGQCLAPDHRPTDLVAAGILERPVALQDPVYWLPEDIRLLRRVEHEFILEDIVVRLDLQAAGQPVPPPEDQVEPVAPEAEAGPPAPAQEHPEENGEGQERVYRLLIRYGRWNFAFVQPAM